MMDAAVIENGKVVNVIVVDSLDVFPQMHLVELTGGAGIGWSYDGTNFIAPESPVTE